MTRRLSSLAVLAFVLVPAVAGANQELLASAKSLYESASYEAALTELNAINSAELRDTVDTYRALCYLGLGRTRDAERALEVLVTRQPLMTLSEAEFSPRIVAMFRDVRRRALPQAAQQLYTLAKGDYENQNYETAAATFKQVLELIDEIDAQDRTQALLDLKQLADGFIALAESKIVKTPPPAAAPAAAVAGGTAAVPQPAATSGTAPAPAPAAATSGPGAPAAAASMTAAAATAPQPVQVFSLADTEVKPPTPVDQRMPAWTFALGAFTRTFSGRVEVTIDTAGAVENVRIVESVWGPYDAQLIEAAKRWRYEPAMKDGKPVKFRRVLDVNIDPTLKPTR